MKALDSSKDYRYGASYEDILDSFEVEVVVRVDDDDYQGDSRLLLRDGDRYGLLFFGWGSCSGCDAAQACSSLTEAIELRDQLWNDIHWEPSKADMAHYVDGKDWSLDYSWHADETRTFLAQVREVLA